MSVYKVRPNNLTAAGTHDELAALALGSGIVVCLYDEEKKVGGMAYVLFPDSRQTGTKQPGEELKYVDTALDILEREVVQAGARADMLWAKIVGGAQIFHFSNMQENVGKKNVEAAKEWMKEKKIPVKAEDTGNDFGRTVHFYLKDGSVKVELVNQYKYYI